jgi:enoyl reductase-like protein
MCYASRPNVLCIVNLRDRGAGIPDGGLFTAEQSQTVNEGALIQGQISARGAIEVKPPAEDLQRVVESAQVQRFLARYNLVLVTNCWSWVLVGYDADHVPTRLESYQLADNEQAFWEASPRQITQAHGVRFIEYLKRVMLHGAPP